MNDLASGQVDLLFDLVSIAAQNVAARRARALATTGTTRVAGPFAHLPTVAETLTGFEVTAWQGVVTRAGTPREIILRLNREFALALENADIRKRLTDLGVEIASGTPEEFAELIERDRGRLGRMIREFDIRVD
jgi:tripartite-type tricarboxylate transporter receptor subunit TctC